MTKIVTLTGAKGTPKQKIAWRLAKNSNVEFVKPYTDREIPINRDPLEFGDYNYVSKDTLDKMLEEEDVLSVTFINGSRYAYFKSQLIAGYNVMIVDDYALVDVRSNWNEELFSIKIVCKNQEPSDRVGVYLYNHEFDMIFNSDVDEYYDIEERIEYG